ncbi:MAG: FKBP-type peptidyl-prolyl cis-trans isomerase [Bacteroidales bacterium]|nr:FKBP-type peptidyl-prolyl cis-trans isomerase [Bacteroidales bacterium]
MAIKVLILTLLICAATSCNPGSEKRENRAGPGKNEMADLNRYFVQKDRERIGNYIERKDLKMTESPTGLWYFIEEVGQGSFPGDNDRVVMEYECSLLDGTVCYTSGKDGVKDIILGRSTIEAGLNQGLRMLRTGGKAMFIIPPFLAYGLTGDGKKIPPRSVLVYSIKIIEVQKHME